MQRQAISHSVAKMTIILLHCKRRVSCYMYMSQPPITYGTLQQNTACFHFPHIGVYPKNRLYGFQSMYCKGIVQCRSRYMPCYGESDTRCTVWQSRAKAWLQHGQKTMSARISCRDHARLYEKTHYIAKSRASRVITRTFPPGCTMYMYMC